MQFNNICYNFVFMSEAALELWNDIDFIAKRVREQISYRIEIFCRYKRGIISKERCEELSLDALVIQMRFINRLDEINGK